MTRKKKGVTKRMRVDSGAREATETQLTPIAQKETKIVIMVVIEATGDEEAETKEEEVKEEAVVEAEVVAHQTIKEGEEEVVVHQMIKQDEAEVADLEEASTAGAA